MGLFRKTLIDAKEFAEDGKIDEALKVLKKHIDQHISENVNGILYRLHRDIGQYRANVVDMAEELSNKGQFSPIRFRIKMAETEELLKRIKGAIKRLLDTERIKLE